ncbi:hypothetical protein OG331_25075 [Streptomyces sp. NBC_01017]|uniref:3'-5' exonuclease n=1 Tax=Streptomyces sp. NBC_01017 TaxID=2903721 RepID=UPI0038698219|nr:hypothetical protein OG331_25075 [Streptomyces sp. NBC_01017]
MNIAFVDCETTHLDAEIGEAWEVAVILREQDGQETTDTEYVWQIRPDLISFDPEALRIGRFEERFAVPPHAEAAFTAHESGHVTPMTRDEAVTAITNVLSGALLVGSNPGFDERHLRKLLGPGAAQWHYRPYDIVQLAAVKLGVYAAGPLPWRSHVLSRAVGVEPPSEDAAHTALGDARWARDVFDAVMTTQETFPLSWEGRAKHAIGLYTRTVIELEDARRDFRRAQASVERARKLASQWGVLRAYGGAATELRAALDDPSQPVNAGEFDTAPVPRTEMQRWQDIAAALNAAHTAGMPVGIDLDGTLTDHNAWSVVWDPTAERWTVAGYEDDDETPCTCTVGEACDQCADGDGLDDEDEESGDADGDVFELISEIASRLRDATDSGEYHAVGLIYDLANGRTTIADARAELAEITFRHI